MTFSGVYKKAKEATIKITSHERGQHLVTLKYLIYGSDIVTGFYFITIMSFDHVDWFLIPYVAF